MKKKIINKNKEETNQKEENKILIYDFLKKCKITKNIHDIMMMKYESYDKKTISEWVSITNLTVLNNNN